MSDQGRERLKRGFCYFTNLCQISQGIVKFELTSVKFSLTSMKLGRGLIMVAML